MLGEREREIERVVVCVIHVWVVVSREATPCG